MEGQYICPGCGYALQEQHIDFAKRRGKCPRCGNVVTPQRPKANTSEVVLHHLDNAVRFFEEGNFVSAKNSAESALAVANDNIVALYIIAYYNAFCDSNKTPTFLDHFFKETLQETDVLEYEMEHFKKIVLMTKVKNFEYEAEILWKLVQTEKEKDLTEFVEAFSPYSITCKRSVEWFNKTKDAYIAVTRAANVPKTWYALFQQITQNPESPEKTGAYFLKTKSEKFYNEFVLGVGEVFANIKDAQLKAKFYGAFEKTKQAIKAKL